jgi:hypothetical protein
VALAEIAYVISGVAADVDATTLLLLYHNHNKWKLKLDTYNIGVFLYGPVCFRVCGHLRPVEVKNPDEWVVTAG